ncbi:MAG: D-Ala-D-Ala carboxypeptidase family metallohydrolase [Dehalococcoidia bacterium]|nr:D-Ala-D-Ala carboxypeptidase family metallohydrolase [Dehalococcoidia bacterium]
MKLSPHFSLYEMTRSSTATRLGIVNQPTPDEVESLRLVCNELLEPVREHWGIPFSPSSGFRSVELNRAVGSSDRSQHVFGQAVDFEIPAVLNMEVAKWMSENCQFDQIILEFYEESIPNSGWIHASIIPDLNRSEVLRYDGLMFYHGFEDEEDLIA